MHQLPPPKKKVLEPDVVFKPGEGYRFYNQTHDDVRTMPDANVFYESWVDVPSSLFCRHRNKRFITRWKCVDCGAVL